MGQRRLQLYRCPNHGVMEGTAAAGVSTGSPAPPSCPVHMSDGERCGNELDGPLVGWLGPNGVEALMQAFETLRVGNPVGRRLRKQRIAREEAEIRADLDYGRG